MKNLTILALASSVALSQVGLAEEAKSADEIAKSLANPNTPLASITVKNQVRSFSGSLPNASSQTGYTALLQPSFPFALDNGSLILWRPALPIVVDQPVFNADKLDFESENGLGDLAFDLAYATTSEAGVMTAFGLITTLPTASSSVLGSGKWSIGPEVLVGKITDKYVLGAFPNHQWDVAGWGENSVSMTSIQLFATWLPGGGWNVGSVPISSYDWTNSQWNIPINLQVGKTVIWNETPWKISAEVNYYVEKSDAFGAEWMVSFNIAPVVQNALAALFK
jgi:hypothetical protein